MFNIGDKIRLKVSLEKAKDIDIWIGIAEIKENVVYEVAVLYENWHDPATWPLKVKTHDYGLFLWVTSEVFELAYKKSGFIIEMDF